MTFHQKAEKFSRDQLIQAIEDLQEALYEFDLYTKMCEGCGVVSDLVRRCRECETERCRECDPQLSPLMEFVCEGCIISS